MSPELPLPTRVGQPAAPTPSPFAPKVARHRAAIHRRSLSRPLRLAHEAGLIASSETFLDYGCGHGDDVRHLRSLGHDAVGWDPHFAPSAPKRRSSVINLGYVLNVIEDPAERDATLLEAWSLAAETLIVAVQLTVDQGTGRATPFGDGVLTGIQTFQKYYGQAEIRDILASRLGVDPVALALGVFAVVRSPERRAALLGRLVRPWNPRRLPRPSAEATYLAHRDALRPITNFFSAHGRWPILAELNIPADSLTPLGGLRRATRFLDRVLGPDWLEQTRSVATADLEVLLALGVAQGWRRPGDLPSTVRRDARALAGTAGGALRAAEVMLRSVGDPGLRQRAGREAVAGKQTPEALYVHHTALSHLPVPLRVFEGLARRFVGAVEGTTLAKLGLRWPAVSYLSYPDFDHDPHPRLTCSVRVDLGRLRVRIERYETRQNPPVLHRKELLVADEYPLRPTFARLTAQEERWDLFDGSTGEIGTLRGWTRRLEVAGVELRGHRVVRRKR